MQQQTEPRNASLSTVSAVKGIVFARYRRDAARWMTREGGTEWKGGVICSDIGSFWYRDYHQSSRTFQTTAIVRKARIITSSRSSRPRGEPPLRYSRMREV